MNAIVVSFDCLPEGFLGCCGNGWMETPNFDRLAARSVLFTQHFAENLDSSAATHAWWSGRYQCRRSGREATPNLLTTLANAGITVRMLCECADNRPSAIPVVPSDCIESVVGSDGLDVPAAETPFWRLVARAQRDLRLLKTSRSEPWLLWIKSRGVPTPWLAPREYAAKFLDIADDDAPEEDVREEDPAEVRDPHESLVEMSAAEFDEFLTSRATLPEERAVRDALTELDRTLIRKVFGGSVGLLDAGLGPLLDAVEAAAASAPTLLIVTAAHGCAVREPGLLRDAVERLGEETVHTPLFIRTAGMSSGVRRMTLSQPVDLFPTLAEWFGLDVREMTLEGRSLLPAVRGEGFDAERRAFLGDGRHGAAIRTPDYYLVVDRDPRTEGGKPVRSLGVENPPRLFAKPEDVWETNDVAAVFPQVVERLCGELDAFFAALAPVS